MRPRCLALSVLLASRGLVSALSGIRACENNGYDRDDCDAVGGDTQCCFFALDVGECKSNIGDAECEGTDQISSVDESLTGKEVCEGQDWDKSTCTSFGCCQYNL